MQGPGSRHRGRTLPPLCCRRAWTPVQARPGVISKSFLERTCPVTLRSPGRKGRAGLHEHSGKNSGLWGPSKQIGSRLSSLYNKPGRMQAFIADGKGSKEACVRCLERRLTERNSCECSWYCPIGSQSQDADSAGLSSVTSMTDQTVYLSLRSCSFVSLTNSA